MRILVRPIDNAGSRKDTPNRPAMRRTFDWKRTSEALSERVDEAEIVEVRAAGHREEGIDVSCKSLPARIPLHPGCKATSIATCKLQRRHIIYFLFGAYALSNRAPFQEFTPGRLPPPSRGYSFA